MGPRVELSSKFYGDPRVLRAQQHSRISAGLFVRALDFMATNNWDPSLGSDRCFGDIFGWMMLDEIGGGMRTRRPFNALERADLWVPVMTRKGKAGGWQFAGSGELWRIKPLREPISRIVRAAVIARDGRTCQLCGGEIPEGDVLHLDHKVPVARHGRSTLDNLQVTHAKCNLSKGARLLEEAA